MVHDVMYKKIDAILKKNNIKATEYYLNGIAGSQTPQGKWGIIKRKENNKSYYAVYYTDEEGKRHQPALYDNEDEAIINYLDKFLRFSAMPIKERLTCSGYYDVWTLAKKWRKLDAIRILEYFKVDSEMIKKIIV